MIKIDDPRLKNGALVVMDEANPSVSYYVNKGDGIKFKNQVGELVINNNNKAFIQVWWPHMNEFSNYWIGHLSFYK